MQIILISFICIIQPGLNRLGFYFFNMKSKVQIIYENLQSIREALYDNTNACVTIDQVAEDVARLASDPSRNGFTTAFVFSSENYPNKPTATTLDVSTGLVNNLDLE